MYTGGGDDEPSYGIYESLIWDENGGDVGSLSYHLRNGVNRAPWYLCGPNWDVAAYGNNGGMFFGEIDPLTDYLYYGSLHGHHLGSSGSYHVIVCYDYSSQGHGGVFCDFIGGNRTNPSDGSPYCYLVIITTNHKI